MVSSSWCEGDSDRARVLRVDVRAVYVRGMTMCVAGHQGNGE